jgi:hypothetical protein
MNTGSIAENVGHNSEKKAPYDGFILCGMAWELQQEDGENAGGCIAKQVYLAEYDNLCQSKQHKVSDSCYGLACHFVLLMLCSSFFCSSLLL